MKNVTLLITLLALMLACAQSGGTNDETTIRTSAVVYEPDGKTPADSVIIKVFNAGAVDGKYVSIQTTAADGRFSLADLPMGEYVIWAQKDSLVTYQTSIVISSNDTIIRDDTLSIPSTVTGIVGVQPQDDPRTVTIQVVGLDKYFDNTDSDGRFTLKNMAEGTYTLLLKSTEPHYTPTTVEVTIAGGTLIKLEDTLRLTYTGIPVVNGLQVVYDTAAGTARLTWNTSDYRGFQNYCIFRDFYDSANYSTSPVAATLDTIFPDTIFSKRLSSGAFSFTDTCDYHFRYRVAIRNNMSVMGPTFKYADIITVSPVKVRPLFAFSSLQIAKNLLSATLHDRERFGEKQLAGEASVNDMVLIFANVTSPIRRLVKMEWQDSAGNMVRTVNYDSTTKVVRDSTSCKWTTTGLHYITCAVTDNAGSLWTDTARIGILADTPEIILTIKDSLTGCTDTIGRTPHFSYGDTIPLRLMSKDRFGSIVNVQWNFGKAVPAGSGSMTFDTFVIAPDTTPSRFPVIAKVSDDDSNVVSDTLNVDLSLFAPATIRAGFKSRTYQSGVMFNDKLWIFGGVGITQQTPKTSFTSLSDSWVSDNGICWTQITTNTPARSGHAMVVFNGKLWLIGGYASSWGKYKNDVWCSTDGASWTCVADWAAFTPRIYHSCIVYNGKIWLIGGLTRTSHMNDVWSSIDGVKWEAATDSAVFQQRCFHSCFVFNDKMWVIGGRDSGYNALNDVWSSVDGVEWKMVTAEANFSPRQGHTSLVYDNKIWVIGGFGFDVSDMAIDIWNSPDGDSWSQVSDSSVFVPRAFHSSMVFHNRMWVIAGMTGYSSLANDVWRSGAFGK